MGKWLELFRALKNGNRDAIRLTLETHDDTCVGLEVSKTPEFSKATLHVSSCVASVSPDLSSFPLINGAAYKLENIGAGALTHATHDDTSAAQVVFCDFETRNTGGCDLTKAGAWRYAADPATEILCFGYHIGGDDHSWAPCVDDTLVTHAIRRPSTYASRSEPWRLIPP
jgi:hypothetical protein